MTKNVHGNTLDRLGEAIVAGRYPAGQSVPPEPTLCEEFGVSRTVVREAVKSLVAKGLLTTGPKVGTRVQPEAQWNWFDPDVVAWQSKAGLTREFLREVQELRRVVEPAAVRMAAELVTSVSPNAAASSKKSRPLMRSSSSKSSKRCKAGDMADEKPPPEAMML